MKMWSGKHMYNGKIRYHAFITFRGRDYVVNGDTRVSAYTGLVKRLRLVN